MREEPTPMPQNVTRRRFIKRSGGATVGTAIGLCALQNPAWATAGDDSSYVLCAVEEAGVSQPPSPSDSDLLTIDGTDVEISFEVNRSTAPSAGCSFKTLEYELQGVVTLKGELDPIAKIKKFVKWSGISCPECAGPTAGAPTDEDLIIDVDEEYQGVFVQWLDLVQDDPKDREDSWKLDIHGFDIIHEVNFGILRLGVKGGFTVERVEDPPGGVHTMPHLGGILQAWTEFRCCTL